MLALTKSGVAKMSSKNTYSEQTADMPANRASEHAEQAAVIDWWRLACRAYGLPEFALFANINGAKLPWARDAKGRRWSAEANRLKAEGLRSGIPDLVLAVPQPRAATLVRVYCGLFIELKRRPNKVTVEQKAVMAYLDSAHYKTVVAWNAEQAIMGIKEYLR